MFSDYCQMQLTLWPTYEAADWIGLGWWNGMGVGAWALYWALYYVYLCIFASETGASNQCLQRDKWPVSARSRLPRSTCLWRRHRLRLRLGARQSINMPLCCIIPVNVNVNVNPNVSDGCTHVNWNCSRERVMVGIIHHANNQRVDGWPISGLQWKKCNQQALLPLTHLTIPLPLPPSLSAKPKG